MPRRRAVRRRFLAALVLVAARASLAAAATFGADLTPATDNVSTCASLFFPSCMFFSGAPGPGFYAPLSGTVTAVHVKTGNFVQGPMQVVVMRSLYQNNLADPGHPFFACCFVERYGPTFTPAPNAITTVPTVLPMVEDPIPPPEDGVTNARGDFLALSVLAPNVPIPATFDDTSGFSGFAPAPDPATTPAPAPNPIFPTVNGLGYHIAMSADLEVGSGGNGDPLPVTIASGGQLVGSTAAIPLTCVLTSACRGVLRVTGLPAGAAVALSGSPSTAKTPRGKLFGKRRFSIASGQTESVGVRLNAAGRRKAKNASTLVVLAIAKLGSRSVTTDVLLGR